MQLQLHRVITFIPFIVNEDREAPTFSGLVRGEGGDSEGGREGEKLFNLIRYQRTLCTYAFCVK